MASASAGSLWEGKGRWTALLCPASQHLAARPWLAQYLSDHHRSNCLWEAVAAATAILGLGAPSAAPQTVPPPWALHSHVIWRRLRARETRLREGAPRNSTAWTACSFRNKGWPAPKPAPRLALCQKICIMTLSRCLFVAGALLCALALPSMGMAKVRPASGVGFMCVSAHRAPYFDSPISLTLPDTPTLRSPRPPAPTASCSRTAPMTSAA